MITANTEEWLRIGEGLVTSLFKKIILFIYSC